MTSRSRTGVRTGGGGGGGGGGPLPKQADTDVEKIREEASWRKVIELAEQLKTRSPTNDCLANFLIGEAKLEIYLEEWPPVEANFSKAKQGLAEAKSFLLLAANDLGKKAYVAMDAHLLLGKLHYACGMFTDSLKNYNLAELHTLTERQLPLRSLRIVAESYAIKGLCLERAGISGGSRFKQAEKENEMIRCFELASELSLLYLQRAEGGGGSGAGSVTGGSSNTGTLGHGGTIGSNSGAAGGSKALGPVLETALQRAPILHIQAGRLSKAVERYREMLTSVESPGTHSLRLILARQLAELLLRGVSNDEWSPPTTKQSEGPWKPKKYSGLNQFIPKNECEETILLLLISEAMAVRDAVLSQSPEFKKAREHAFENASAIYDLLTIATVRWGQVALLQESFDRAMKFSFEEIHIWQQQALALTALGRSARAVSVLAQVIKLNTTAIFPCLLAARQCYESLNLIADGLKYSTIALDREHERPTYMLSRCHLYVAIGHLMTARSTTIQAEKVSANTKCLESLQKSVNCDPNDHLALFYLAFQYALIGNLSEAMIHVRSCLSKRSECSAAMQLLCLLLSARGRLKEALATAKAALDDHPDSLDLLRILALLQLRCQGPEVALSTGKRMLTLWKTLFESGAVNDTSNDFDKKSETRSMLHLYNDKDSTKDSSSLQANSLAASRVERALSSAASSAGTPSGSAGADGSSSGGPLLRLRIWLLLAELYLAMDSVSAAAACVSEAASIFPLSHNVMYMRGMVHTHKEEWSEARQCFQNAVAINPSHVESLVQLGLCHHHLGSQRLAEKIIRDAARLEPNNHTAWYSLGLVLESLEECDTASDCFATALNVELSSPVLPFSSIAYIFE